VITEVQDDFSSTPGAFSNPEMSLKSEIDSNAR
jgi:hypothetical protein